MPKQHIFDSNLNDDEVQTSIFHTDIQRTHDSSMLILFDVLKSLVLLACFIIRCLICY